MVALAGTDHHPYERMVEWVDAAAERRPDVRFLVQHGSTTRAPRVAEGAEFLAHDRLVALLREAAVVVCHGGPGTIMDAREAGHVPLCMPRDPALGEHVDGHQQRFAAHVGDAGVVRHVTLAASPSTSSWTGHCRRRSRRMRSRRRPWPGTPPGPGWRRSWTT